MNDRLAISSRPLTQTNPGQWKVEAGMLVNYEVIQIDGIFEPGSTELLKYCGTSHNGRRQMVVVDANVERLYGDKIRAYYDHHDIACELLTLTVSEQDKTFETAMAIVRHMESKGVLRRTDPIVGVGGGVLLDLVGFAASLYRRGVPYIKVPTNGMAMWDAAVGVKTAINVLERRNRLGTYHPPAAALLDRSFLKTVAERELSNGLGEILKMAVIKDLTLFNILERNSRMLLDTAFQDKDVAPVVIERSVHGMLEELAPNLWERSLERAVDFGHTFSPLIEMKALPELLHGEAVALDVLFSCWISFGRGLLTETDVFRVIDIMVSMKLPLHHRLFANTDLLAEALADTMRHRDGLQRLPLPNKLGSYCFINDLTQQEIVAAAKRMAYVGS